MKKLFLTLSAAALATVAVNAEVTLSMADAYDIQGTYVEASGNAGEHYQPLESLKVGDFTFTTTSGGNENSSQIPAYYTGSNATIRVYLSNTLQISNPDVDLCSIEFTCKSLKGVSANNPITVNGGGTITYNGSKFTWTRPATDQIINEITLSIPSQKDGSTNPNVQISSIVVTGVGEQETPVNPDLATASSIAEIYALGADDNSLPIKADFPMTVTYVNGINVFATDGTTATLIYGSTPYSTGDVIAPGMVVNYSPYGGLPELKPVADYTLPEVSSTVNVEYPTVALADITEADLNRVVKISSVTFAEDTPAARSNYTGTDGDLSMTFRNQFNLASYPAGEYEVTAVIGYFTPNIQIQPIAFELKGIVTPPETGIVIYSGLLDNDEGWTYENIEVPEDSYVWSWAGNYGIKATGFFAGGNHATKAWAISPVFDLSGYENCTVAFEQAANYFGDTETFSSMTSIWVREAEGEWDENLNPDALPAGNSWTFVNTDELSLSAFDGKKIQLGFYYTSTEELSGTWEVRNMVVKGDRNTGVAEIENNDAAVEYYNLQGVRVINPSEGIFIKRQGNKVTKVLVK